MSGQVLLAADWGQVIGVVVFLVVAGISALGQWLNNMQQQRQRQQPRQQRAPRPDPFDVAPEKPAAPRPQALDDEIGDFLRRAAQNRGGDLGQRPQEAGGAMGRPAARPVPARPVVARPVQAQPMRAEIVEPARREVGEGMVRKDLDTAEFQRRAASLGQTAKQAGRNVETRLHEKFDHAVGSLDARATRKTASLPESASESAAPAFFPPTSAAGFATLLHDAETVRQAVILSEILQRPEHRW